MLTLFILWNNITFSFNPPVSETWFLAEDFDFTKKPAYATQWVQELLKYTNELQIQSILWKIFHTITSTVEVQKLDYLQNININWVDTWLIDDGNTICLMTKGEY